MAKKKSGTQLVTPKFRVSFPAVFEARAAVQGQKLKFSVVMLFDKATTDFSGLKAAAMQAATDKWGADQAKWPKGIRFPFRDGTEKDYDGYGEDVVFATASSIHKPGLVDQKLQPIIEPSEFFGGCYALATVVPYAWEYMGKAGVSFGLRNIQKHSDGEPFSGKSKPENDFDAIPVPEASNDLNGATPANAGGLMGELGGDTKAPKAATASADPMGGIGI